MQYSLAAFYEPRGVMRILQFIFAIVAFATTANFTTTVVAHCPGTNGAVTDKVYTIEYPFRISICNDSKGFDASSDSQFFVATGVLSMMYCIFIIFVYAIIDELYRTKTEFPLADFFLTTILAIFWLAGSSAWSNETTAIKGFTDPDELKKVCSGGCTYETGSFSKLNISLIIGFLNFFLWTSGLWFLYKETVWFQGRQNQQNTGAGTSTMGQPNV